MSLNKTDYIDYAMSNIDALMSDITINIQYKSWLIWKNKNPQIITIPYNLYNI